jgi:hypothetical protein
MNMTEKSTNSIHVRYVQPGKGFNDKLAVLETIGTKIRLSLDKSEDESSPIMFEVKASDIKKITTYRGSYTLHLKDGSTYNMVVVVFGGFGLVGPIASPTQLKKWLEEATALKVQDPFSLRNIFIILVAGLVAGLAIVYFS